MTNSFGDYVRQERLRLNITQRACAAASDFKYGSSFMRLERNQAPWRLEYIQKIAKLLGYSSASVLLHRYEVSISVRCPSCQGIGRISYQGNLEELPVDECLCPNCKD